MPTTPEQFEPVEKLRKRLLISKSQMAELLNVSRQTYHAWHTGKYSPTRRGNHDKLIIEAARRMMAVIKKYDWPTPNAMAAQSDARYEMLKKLLESV
jgi:DNA-binding transcriptional regulator YiaG